MAAIILGLLAAACFVAPSLLAARRTVLRGQTRSLAIAVAAGILLMLAFGEFFPEGLELAGRRAIIGFVGGFALLFLIEVFTHAHTHHAADEPVHRHSIVPFVVGMAIHNAADGFALGVSTMLSTASAIAVGFGVLIHQVPVAISLAAVFAATGVPRHRLIRTSIPLALLIPLVAGLTVAIPAPGEVARGVLTGVTGGVLTYLGATHLLPEAQAEHPSAATGVGFLVTLVATGLILFVVIAH